MSFHICELKILCTKMNIYNIRIYCCFVLTKYSKCTQMPHCERRGILMLYTHEGIVSHVNWENTGGSNTLKSEWALRSILTTKETQRFPLAIYTMRPFYLNINTKFIGCIFFS